MLGKAKGGFYLTCLLLCFCFAFDSHENPAPVTCREIIDKMQLAMDNVKTLRYTEKIIERFKGVLKKGEARTKVNRNPFKVYLNANGPELLYKEGWNDGKVLVNPNGFPYVNLSLDPLGSTLRDGQHHTIFEVGFDYYDELLSNAVKVVGKDFGRYFKFLGDSDWNGKSCYLINIEYPSFTYVDYVMKKGETVLSVSKSLKVGAYMILEANPGKLKGYSSGSQGLTIKVPSVYSKNISMWVDKKVWLPVATKIYDDKGLWESYEYHNLEVNPSLTDMDFSQENKEYGF